MSIQVRDCRDAIHDFKTDMLHKLSLNMHKKHWRLETHDRLAYGLINETEELFEEVDKLVNGGFDQAGKKEILYNIIHEAADVANYAMFFADKARKRIAEMEQSEMIEVFGEKEDCYDDGKS
jgi:NTP pyrophosphatase (non-canonical NTP hydrolase)